MIHLIMGLITKLEFSRNTGRHHGSFFCHLCNNDQDSTLIDTTIEDQDGNLILICKECVEKMRILFNGDFVHAKRDELFFKAVFGEKKTKESDHD